MNKLKKTLDIIIGSRISYGVSRNLYLKRLFPFVHAVTYHGTPNKFKDNLRHQFAWYKENYVNCDLLDLHNLLIKGVWPHKKPGLIITFDDGLKSNFDIALPLLEEYGFSGWFMIPAGFIGLDPTHELDFARENSIDTFSESYGMRIAMSWDEICEIDGRGHYISCHSMSHKRLSSKLNNADLEIEIDNAKKMLENQIGHPVDSFTWVGGEEWSYSPGAYERIILKFKLVFCTNCAPITSFQSPLMLQRYHIDAYNDVNRLRMVLGGLYDLIYFRKRRRVLKALKISIPI